MTYFPYAVENRVVPGPALALFHTKEEADEYVKDSIDLRVIPNTLRLVADSVRDSAITDTQLNRMAQFLYEGISIAPDLTLYMDMTSKATLVRVLREAMIRAEIISDRNAWTVATLHMPDCPRCEECADLAVSSAKATGSSGGSWQLTEPMPDGQHSIMHRAVVERKA